MTLRISLVLLATLLFVTVLATLSGTANAHSSAPPDEDVVASRMMATGPLNVVVLRVSGS